MTARNTAGIPPGLEEPEYMLLWAVINRAKYDAGLLRHGERTRTDPELQEEAAQFLAQFAGLACA